MTAVVRCPVCLDDFKEKDLVRLRHRNNDEPAAKTHKLCTPCFKGVAQQNGNCPLCRDTIVVTRSSFFSSRVVVNNTVYEK
jgi:hypothetical protein